MGLMFTDDREENGLSSRIASEMKRKLDETSDDNGEKPLPVEAPVEESAYYEKFEKKPIKPYVWRFALIVCLFVAILLLFIFML